ncbi:MAG TPA: family 20 glycosylhydrolase [Rhodothermales bacterium]|nr:family 20 glycosylhydrolase [Rhodothermales bacterium]
MSRRVLSCTLFILLLVSGSAVPLAAAQGSQAKPPAILPFPQHVELTEGTVDLPEVLSCEVNQDSLKPLIPVVDYEYHRLTGGHTTSATPGSDPYCHLVLDPSLDEEAYHLRIGPGVTVTGGSYRAVAMGTVSFLQSITRSAAGATAPALYVDDRPDRRYRGLLIDVARTWHDLSTLKQLILLARWYKINYLQLHLTDYESFTFPTESYPDVPTPGRHYTKEELRGLDAFARQHGVTLVPELEVPGHSGQLISTMPELFGIANVEENGGTLNMGREEVYQALDRIIGEVADVFQTTPYIHMGGDEASLEGLDEDPDVQRYLTAHGLDNVDELYRQFIVRVNDMIRSHGKQTVLWEGFHKEGKVKIPRNILVMAWETVYQLPQDLLSGGYTVINASWVPYYVVNEKKWDPEEIYGWNIYKWGNWVKRMPSYHPIQLDSTAQVIGASMETWSQPQYMEIPSLRERLPAFIERTWNASVAPEQPFPVFMNALTHTDASFRKVLSPITIHVDGLRYPDLKEGHYDEQYWFGDRLTLSLSTEPGSTIYYTLDGTLPTPESKRYSGPITLSSTASVRVRAFANTGEPVGYDVWHLYELHPIEAAIAGKTGPTDRLWEKMDSRVPFSDQITISLRSSRPGTIRYTIDGSEPSPASPAYTAPLVITDTTDVWAQLFDSQGRALGEPWAAGYVKQ